VTCPDRSVRVFLTRRDDYEAWLDALQKASSRRIEEHYGTLASGAVASGQHLLLRRGGGSAELGRAGCWYCLLFSLALDIGRWRQGLVADRVQSLPRPRACWMCANTCLLYAVVAEWFSPHLSVGAGCVLVASTDGWRCYASGCIFGLSLGWVAVADTLLLAMSSPLRLRWTVGWMFCLAYIRPSAELGSLLGEGAFARVVMGLDRTTLQQYAVKVIEKQSDDAQGLEFIWRELNVMKAVNHPNIVRTYDIFDTRTRLYIVLEYMPGGTLADLLKHTGRFTEAQARPVLRDILRGVAYLHSKSVVHRDLKLKNILCDRRELPVSVKLAGTLWFVRGTRCWCVGAMTTRRDGPCCVCVSASCLVCIRDVLTHCVLVGV